MEMMIVLAVLSMIAALSLPYIYKSLDKAVIKKEARQLRSDISRTRLSSIREGKVKFETYYGEPVVFYPNGRTSDGRFKIVCGDYYITARLRSLTGKVQIDRPKKL